MEYKVKEYAIYSAGHRSDTHGRPQQEDYIYPPLGSGKATDTLFVVCDGMGQQGSGLQASSTVCHAIAEYVSTLDEDTVFTSGDMQQAIGAGYAALDRLHTNALSKIGTTVAVLKLTESGYMTAHMGDSRIYHIRPGQTAASTKLLFRTEDHTLANHLVSKGEMSVEEAMTSPKRQVITRAMQPNMQRRSTPEIHMGSDVRPGDYFLLVTDGMLEHLDDTDLRMIFSAESGNAKNKTALLTKATSDNTDNHSAIIVQIQEIDKVAMKEERPLEETPRKRSNDKPQTPKPQIPKSPTKMTNNVRDFVERQKASGDTTGTLLIKFLFLLMGLMLLIIMIYYLFIRSNETLQTAGTAIEQPFDSDDEVYGYEITEQDIRNEAQQIAIEPEDTEEVDEEITEEPQDEATIEEEPMVEDTPQTDEPILLQ